MAARLNIVTLADHWQQHLIWDRDCMRRTINDWRRVM